MNAPLPPKRPAEAPARAEVAQGTADDRVTGPAPSTPAIVPPAVSAPAALSPAVAPPAVIPPPIAQASPLPKPATAAEVASSAEVSAPLPPPRPPVPAEARVAALPTPAATEEAVQKEAAVPAPPKSARIPTVCPEISNEDLGVFSPVAVETTQTACTVDRGVSLEAVRMKDGRLVKLQPAALLRCEMAAAVAAWLREGVDPLIDTLGTKLETVKVAGSQQCRPRNRVAGAKISEHGRGNALDTAGYVLKDGRELMIGGKGATAMPLDFQEKLKASACADFTTILGPGSDGYHETHLHVDRASRRSGMVLCQWTIKAAR